jgi:hypothetical protein
MVIGNNMKLVYKIQPDGRATDGRIENNDYELAAGEHELLGVEEVPSDLSIYSTSACKLADLKKEKHQERRESFKLKLKEGFEYDDGAGFAYKIKSTKEAMQTFHGLHSLLDKTLPLSPDLKTTIEDYDGEVHEDIDPAKVMAMIVEAGIYVATLSKYKMKYKSLINAASSESALNLISFDWVDGPKP